MKAFIFSFLVFMLANFELFAQKDPIEGTLNYQNGEKRVAIAEVPYSVESIEGALKNYLEKTDVKEQRLKGMQVFKNARLTPTDGEIADLYFKVEKKGRKEDSMSVVYLLIGRPNENVGLRMADDAYRIKDAKSFLSNLNTVTKSYELETNISKTDENIKKSEKKLKDIQDEQKSLERKIQDLQDRLEQRRKDQESTLADISRFKSEKEALTGKRITSK
jgi:gas vesicle protein